MWVNVEISHCLYSSRKCRDIALFVLVSKMSRYRIVCTRLANVEISHCLYSSRKCRDIALFVLVSQMSRYLIVCKRRDIMFPMFMSWRLLVQVPVTEKARYFDRLLFLRPHFMSHRGNTGPTYNRNLTLYIHPNTTSFHNWIS